MNSSQSGEICLNKLCRKREREKRRNMKEELQFSEWLIYQWEESGSGGEEPFPEGTFERLKSNNIWEKVSEYLTNPTDITNAALAFPEDFTEKRMLTHLPEALRILRWEDCIYSGQGRNQKINCLGVRGVSKAWKKIFDEEILEHNFSWETWYMMNLRNQDDAEICYFSNEVTVDTALAAFPSSRQVSKSSLSLIRKLCVDTSQITGDHTDAFHAKVINFLGLYGESVWLLMYKSPWSPHEESQSIPSDRGYERICEMVKLTPNLKALILEGVTNSHFKLSDSEAKAENDRLKEKIRQSPFPMLLGLEYFHFDEADNALILAEIFRNCVNIKSVTSTYPHWITVEMTEALENLELERYYQMSEEVILSISENTIWPLNSLSINVEDPEFATTSFLWPFINRFRATLERLALNIPVEKDDPNVRLDLPQLKFLMLETMTPPRTIGFDDLLMLGSLEKLLIYGDVKCSKDENPQIYVVRFKGKLVYTNIWNCFQNLELLKIIGDRDTEIYRRPQRLKAPARRPSKWKTIKKWVLTTFWSINASL